MRSFSLLPALALSALLLGCGSSDESLSKDEWADKADTICKKYNTQASNIPTPTGGSQTELPTGLAEYSQKRLNILKEEVEEIKGLGDIDSGTANTQKNDLLNGLDELIAKSEELQKVTESATSPAEFTREANKLDIVQLKLDLRNLSQGLGLNECGSER